jgi:hypothetical protein
MLIYNGIEPSCTHHPIDDIEPEEKEKNSYRQASLRQVAILNRAFDYIISSRDPVTASWQVAFALGLIICAGRTMSDVGAMCGVTKACISKGARNFCEKNNLPPSFYMKTPEAVEAYRKERKSQLTQKKSPVAGKNS